MKVYNPALIKWANAWDARVLPQGLLNDAFVGKNDDLVVKPAQPDARHDVLSMVLIATGRCADFMENIKRSLVLLSASAPFAITSCFRPTGTHRFGAVDLAPYFPNEPRYAHNAHWDPRLYARPALLLELITIAETCPDITFLVEDNHIHVHDNLNPGVPAQLNQALFGSQYPVASSAGGTVAIQINPRPGYKRTDFDTMVDASLSDNFFWRRLDRDTIATFPEFRDRSAQFTN